MNAFPRTTLICCCPQSGICPPDGDFDIVISGITAAPAYLALAGSAGSIPLMNGTYHMTWVPWDNTQPGLGALNGDWYWDNPDRDSPSDSSDLQASLELFCEHTSGNAETAKNPSCRITGGFGSEADQVLCGILGNGIGVPNENLSPSQDPTNAYAVGGGTVTPHW